MSTSKWAEAHLENGDSQPAVKIEESRSRLTEQPICSFRYLVPFIFRSQRGDRKSKADHGNPSNIDFFKSTFASLAGYKNRCHSGRNCLFGAGFRRDVGGSGNASHIDNVTCMRMYVKRVFNA